ncbi:protein-tyrosine phosphatase [Enteractinococcus fodinae]|uniref:Protein-tyrosine phosphatase n=1 Tax=Enteractinococcus fodinae TaxID=684663 RepID=A0ABU2B4U0_9MICC|nr:protein-tyrosine phosphatase [Enteractinococcus fodinae]
MHQSINTPSIKTLSAGTQALVGHQMPEIQQEIATQLGVEAPEEHRAQQLALQHVESADLILGMERQHRSEAVKLSPRALRRTFTLRELARIAELVPDEDIAFSEAANLVENMKALVEAAAVNRGLAVSFEDPEDDDVVDPYRRSKQTYKESRDQVVSALGGIVTYLNRAAV